MRKVLCLTLQLQGFQTLSAASAAEALELARSMDAPLDLLLTDVVLPESSGPELAQKICAQFPELAVLYISGYSEELLQDYGLSSGDAAFLAKPFSSVALGEKIKQLLGH